MLIITLREFRGHTHYLPKIIPEDLHSHKFRLPPQRLHIEGEEGWSYHTEWAELRELYNKLVEERDVYKKAFEEQLQAFGEYAKSRGVPE